MTTQQALAVAGRQTWASHDDFETRKAALEQLASETRRLEAVLRGLRVYCVSEQGRAVECSGNSDLISDCKALRRNTLSDVLAKLDELERA